MLEDFVLQTLRAATRPLGAYEIAQRSEQKQVPLAPSQVYRILERLIAKASVRRVEMLSAYVLSDHHRCGIIVCRECQTVESFDAAPMAQAIVPLCSAHGFEPAMSVIEVSGLCHHCSDGARASSRQRGGGMAALMALLAAAGASLAAAYAETEASDRKLVAAVSESTVQWRSLVDG